MEMLIDNYDIEVSTPACDLESPVFMAKVALSVDISGVLPYVNAAVEKGEFLPDVPVLVWKEDSRKYALRSHEIAVSNIADRDEAGDVVATLVAKLNTIWADRDNLEPSYATWEKPKVLEVFKLLPRTNCGQCGVPTCMAYAAKLADGKKSLEDCPAMCDPDCAEKLDALRSMGL